jgi:hypothetical protein
MASDCFSLLRFAAARVTKLTSCGAVATGSCSTVSTVGGIITVAMTREVVERQDYTTLDGDGNICIGDTKAEILKWIPVEITFCKVDPEMYNIMTGEPLVLNDATLPLAVGWRTQQGAASNAFFGFEGWVRVSGSDQCDGTDPQYGYFVLPFVKEAVVGDVTFENAAATFTVSGIAVIGSQWGVGPYNVRKFLSGPDLGEPGPLLTAIGPLDFRHLQLTTLPPPLDGCGCTALPATLTVVDPGAGLTANMTIPNAALLPAYVDWGDVSPTQLIPVGTVSPVTHLYAAGGPYTVTFRSQSHSAPTYTGNVTMVP